MWKMPFALKLFNNKLFYFKNESTKDLLTICSFLPWDISCTFAKCTYIHGSYTLPWKSHKSSLRTTQKCTSFRKKAKEVLYIKPSCFI